MLFFVPSIVCLLALCEARVTSVQEQEVNRGQLHEEDSAYWSRHLDRILQNQSLSPTPSPTTECGVAEYEQLEEPAECDDLESGHTNYYWGNDNFLCRLNERLCDTESENFEMDLGSDGVLKIDNGSWDYGDAEVWAVFADNTGQMWNGETDDRNYCFRFRAEGHWYYFGAVSPGPNDGFYELISPGVDVNDYEFGSLECCDPQDEDSRFYIIIDGVLVDSCPESVGDKCRDCEVLM